MDIAKAIQARLDSDERSKMWLVRRSQVGKTAFYEFMQGNSDMMIYNLELVAKGFGIKLSTLIKEAENESNT